jgi:hypothetical protein
MIMNNKKPKTLSEYPDVISPEEIKEILELAQVVFIICFRQEQ